MLSHRSQLESLINRAAIPEDQVGNAVHLAGLYPSGTAWRFFLDRLLLWLGILALAFSVLFFVAYNWTDLGRLFRFGLVESALVVALTAYWKFSRHRVAAQAS